MTGLACVERFRFELTFLSESNRFAELPSPSRISWYAAASISLQRIRSDPRVLKTFFPCCSRH